MTSVVPLNHSPIGVVSKLVFTILVLILSVSSLAAQLVPGDIAFTGMNTDGNTDNFAFVALVDLPAGESITITDAGWDYQSHGFNSGETWVTYNVPGTGLPAGSVVELYLPGALSSAGDQLIAYQIISGNRRIIAALNNRSASWQASANDEHSSALPPNLSDGNTALALSHKDNMKYTGSLTTGTQQQLLTAINNPANWSGSNSYNQNFSSLSFMVLPGDPVITMGDLALVDEGAGTCQLEIYASQTGSHTASLSTNGGTAQNGLDFNLGTTNINFISSRIFTYNFNLIDDSDCESLENLILQLSPANGNPQILSNGQNLSISDNDNSTFEVFQGFENSSLDSWNYTYYPVPYNTETGPDPATVYGTESVWTRAKSFSNVFYAPQGDYFWGMQHLDNNAGGGSFWHYIDFEAIPLQAADAAVLKFKYFTFNSTAQDQIEYAVQYDNGSNWSSFVALPINTNAWIEETIQVPTGASHVRLRVRAKETSGILCGGIDEVSLVGTICSSNNSLTTGNVSGVYCASGASISIPFSSTGTFLPGNIFTAELSDATGSFANPIAVGNLSLSGNAPTGIINGSIPTNTIPGPGYRVRVRSSAPNLIGTDNGVNLILSQLSYGLASPTFANGANVSCPGSTDGSINLSLTNVQAPAVYTWTGPNGFSASTQNLSGLAAGTYTVSVLDAAGCQVSQSITLTEPALAVNLQAESISCHGASDGQINANLSGWTNPSISWTGPNGYNSTANPITGLGAGMYIATVTDALGCSLTDSALVAEPGSLQLQITSPTGPCGHHISCANGSDGSIDLSLSGGTAPFTYAWTGPGGFVNAQQDLSGLSAGTYTVTVTDVNGCTANGNVSLNQPSPMSAGIDALTFQCGYNISCNGASDGGAFVVGLNGGCPPYSYLWSNGNTSPNSTNLSAAFYSVTITDTGGCELVKSVTLTEPAAITFNYLSNPASCDDAPNGSIDMYVNGGCPPYLYTWTGPNGFSSTETHPDTLFAGTYHYAIVDQNGCNISGDIEIQALNNVSASLGCCQDTAICLGDSVHLNVSFTGIGPFEVAYLLNGDTVTAIGPTAQMTISELVTAPLHIELLSVTSLFSGCTGTVCGSATIGVNDCGGPCEDICVNTGVLSVVDNGNCRTVNLEVACDTFCALGTAHGCPGTRLLTFNTFPNGNAVPAGLQVGNQWADLGISFSFVNANPNHPQMGIVFDSSHPSGGDADLGTPNQDFGGPGIGNGGGIGAAGENSVALGNLLIIAENDLDVGNDGLIDNPNDEAAGGELRMHFAQPYFVESVHLVDLDNGSGFVRVTQSGNQITDFNIPGLGDNAVTEVMINLDDVLEIAVILPGSGGISALAFCPRGPEFVDISIPCGNVSSMSNSADLPMELIASDSVTGISGIRVHGLPSDCFDSTGLGAFTIQYELCDLVCDQGFCPPLVVYGRNNCLQYEQAVMGPVAPIAPAEPAKEDPYADHVQGQLDVYPNPVVGASIARMYLRNAGMARLSIYNLSGEKVKELFTGEFDKEEQKEVEFDLADLPAGMYIMRLVTVSDEVFTRRFILSK